MAVDPAGNVFIADRNNHRVRKVDAATGVITTVAGTGSDGYAGGGGLATAAALYYPSGVAVDAAGNLYIADTYNHRVRRVDAATGTITTVAGTGVQGYGGDGGPATGATLSGPAGVAVDALGNLFIADEGNCRVRRVDAATGTITTVAGTGVRGYAGDGGPATSAELTFPSGVAVDAAGTVFIADRANNRVRRVDATTGVITTVAGIGSFGYSGDGGPATSAALGSPEGLAVDGAGNLFIADTSNNRVRRVDAATGVITTLAGASGSGSWGDGGPAAGAALSVPGGVAVDATGNIFIADMGNQRVRRIDARTGIISIVAGTIVAGNPLVGHGGDGGPATGATLSGPTGVAVDGAGNLFIADKFNNRIRKVAAAGDGRPAAYTVTIRNTSPASTDPVTVTSVTDALLGDLTAVAVAANGGADIVLAPRQAFTFSVTGPALTAGPVVTTVTVTAHDDEGTSATASDTVIVTVT